MNIELFWPVDILVSGTAISWQRAPSLILGAVLSVPLDACMVSRLPAGRLAFLTGGVFTTLLECILLKLMIVGL